MVTTSRVIVVLRGELGNQLKLAHERIVKIQNKEGYTRKEKDLDSAFKSSERIDSAIHALGRLNLGDIEDIEIDELF